MVTRKSIPVLGALVAVRHVEALASSAMLPFVVLWAHRNAGLSGVAAGALFVGQAAGELVGGIAGGGLADRYGRRRVLMISSLGMAAGYGLLALAQDPALAVALFLGAGLFESAFHPTIAALVGDVVPDEQLPRAFSLLRVGANAGRLVGPLLGAVAALAGLPLVFALSGVLLLLGWGIGALLLPRSLDERRTADDDDPEIPPGTLRALRTDVPLAALVLGGGLLAVTFTWWQADGLVLVREQTPVGTGAYAALFTIAAATVVVGQLPLTRLLHRVPDSAALLVGAAVQGAGLAVLAGARGGYLVLVLAVVLLALGEMTYAPTISTVVSRRARCDQRASYQAALSITEDIGTAVGPLSGLALVRVTTTAGLWLTGAVLSAAAGVIARRAVERPRVLDAARRTLSGPPADVRASAADARDGGEELLGRLDLGQVAGAGQQGER